MPEVSWELVSKANLRYHLPKTEKSADLALNGVIDNIYVGIVTIRHYCIFLAYGTNFARLEES